MFCSKCGKEINDEAIVCPNCGCATNNYKESVVAEISPDYPLLEKFRGKVNVAFALGIVSLLLCMGIGLGFQIGNFIYMSTIHEPELTLNNPREIAEFERAKRKLRTASMLTGIGFALTVGMLFILGGLSML